MRLQQSELRWADMHFYTFDSTMTMKCVSSETSKIATSLAMLSKKEKGSITLCNCILNGHHKEKKNNIKFKFSFIPLQIFSPQHVKYYSNNVKTSSLQFIIDLLTAGIGEI